MLEEQLKVFQAEGREIQKPEGKEEDRVCEALDVFKMMGAQSAELQSYEQ